LGKTAARTRTHRSARRCTDRREEDRRNKRFYRLSDDGELMLERLRQEWQQINASLDRLI
jgi:DNA-binding PadR family transcriptional regulator